MQDNNPLPSQTRLSHDVGERVFHEQMLSLAQAARRLPTLRGRKSPHPATLFRWATAGRKGRNGAIVRLEIWRVGGTNCTSIEALTRFFDRLNDGLSGATSQRVPETDNTLAQQAKQAKDILQRRGLI